MQHIAHLQRSNTALQVISNCIYYIYHNLHFLGGLVCKFLVRNVQVYGWVIIWICTSILNTVNQQNFACDLISRISRSYINLIRLYKENPLLSPKIGHNAKFYCREIKLIYSKGLTCFTYFVTPGCFCLFF